MSEPYTDTLIFVTLKDGEYADRFTDSTRTELIWCGQRKGQRDHLVEPNTDIWVRENKNEKKFTRVGRVVTKTMIRGQDTSRGRGDEHAIYTLTLHKYTTEIVVFKESDDRYTHNAVLRAAGYREETGAMPHGIYWRYMLGTDTGTTLP
jgi:hypothetical protein